MSAAQALAAVRAGGISLAVDGADLILEGSNSPSPAVLDLVRLHKAEIIAAITATPPTNQETGAVVDCRDFYEERAAIRQYDAHYSRAEAEALAWGEMQNRWHAEHGERVSRDLCAGCRRPIGTEKALDLIDGNRVHLGSNTDCLIRHGERWRAAAARALMALGLRPPVGVDQ
jgi:hypothetical protein